MRGPKTDELKRQIGQVMNVKNFYQPQMMHLVDVNIIQRFNEYTFAICTL